ncbi:polygalacturonase, putative [Ricinus communis]|uniref:Polygalacturonase, putative n=1 Tax=Ricinus communis TaxID=3988 RepID=B9RV49_RICCO|nr:polygalacturonase, putative [Ricinus communis]
MFSVAWSQRKYNVLSYGAVGNGIVDDTMAFMKAWNDTCKDSRRPVMVVPMGKTFFVYPVTLFGPCNSSNLIVMILGTIIAPDHPNVWNGRFHGTWLAFRYVNDLTVSGNGVGVLDGRGHRWWEISCRYNKSKIISFEMCKNVNLRRISTVRSGGGHIAVFGCENVRFSILNLQSPGKSPNTDGIHISHSNFVHIHKSVIGSGDDCISMLDRSYNVNITNINCGPGHGISIGSLGSDGTKVDVQNITIRNVNFYKTTNGARIKTWQGGSGYVRNVLFENITLLNTSNPINIDQYYCPRGNCAEQASAVKVSGITFTKFKGSSFTDPAINIACSETVGCSNIVLDNIDITPSSGIKKHSILQFHEGEIEEILFTILSHIILTPMLRKIKELLIGIIVLAIWSKSGEAISCSIITDVMQYGAVGDGEIDDSELRNPTNTGRKDILVKASQVSRSCKSSPINIQKFDEIGGRRPTALTFDQCNNLQLSGLTHINSAQDHIHFSGCSNVLVSDLHITAPESSPNTDGINISHSSNIQIHDCTIGTGDDCVAIGGGSSNINITGVTCGPGHGISIGSLGKNGKSDTVEEVYVKDCTLKGTTNGLRIKTWQGGSGHARQIHFEGITLDAVDNPIIIDQYYCEHKSACKNQTSAVKVSNIFYKGVHGTSITEEAIQLRCSQSTSCSNIFLSDIDIISANQGIQTHAFCFNAYGTASYSTPVVNCLTTSLSYEGLPSQQESGCQSRNSQSVKVLHFLHEQLIVVLTLLCFAFLHLLAIK